MHDPEFYPEPDLFNPERYANLTPEQSKRIDPRNFAFGFGRRICVGALFGDNALFISFATLLACFNIRKQVVNGKEVDPVVSYPDLVGHPQPFVCDVSLRSEAAGALINSAVEAGMD